MKILVVDDSDFARQRIGKMLRDGGHEVIEADGSEAALRIEEETKFQAVTVDLLMPGMDGIELIRRLRQLRPELHIIALSADVQQATRREALAAGATCFVAKTAPIEVLLAAIDTKPSGLIPLVLSAGQKEAFTEMMNIAMGQAAEALSVLLKRRVLLKVPEVELMTAAGLTAFFREELVQVGVTIRQRFSGKLNGTAAMVFSSGHAAFLVRTLVGIQQELSQLSSAEQSVLSEIGNIVLNAAIAVLADHADGRLRVSLPDVSLNQQGDAAARDLIGASAGATGAFVLVSSLTIRDAELISYLILLLPEEDVKWLLVRFGK